MSYGGRIGPLAILGRKRAVDSKWSVWRHPFSAYRLYHQPHPPLLAHRLRRRVQHLAIVRWLITDVHPVDGTDLSGSTALYHAISTKPAFDPEYAQLLYDAGADVNRRNRYGGTPAHESTMVWDVRNPAAIQQACTALKWFLEHGGNVDVKDSDGVTARHSIETWRKASQNRIKVGTWKVLEEEDRRRARLVGEICAFCGRPPRGDVKLLVCSRCRTAKYCSSGFSCQRADWAHHKPLCKKTPA